MNTFFSGQKNHLLCFTHHNEQSSKNLALSAAASFYVVIMNRLLAAGVRGTFPSYKAANQSKIAGNLRIHRLLPTTRQTIIESDSGADCVLLLLCLSDILRSLNGDESSRDLLDFRVPTKKGHCGRCSLSLLFACSSFLGVMLAQGHDVRTICRDYFGHGFAQCSGVL